MAIEDFQSFCHYIYIYSSPHIFGFWKDHKLKNMGCSKLPSIHFPLTLGTWVWHGNLSCVSWGDELAIQMVPIFSGKLTLTHLIGFQNLFLFFFQFIHVTGMQSNLYVILLSFKHLVFFVGGKFKFSVQKKHTEFWCIARPGSWVCACLGVLSLSLLHLIRFSFVGSSVSSYIGIVEYSCT